MGQPSQAHRTELFAVRIWQEDLGNGQYEWRGKVQHVTSGEASYFRDWAALIAFLVTPPVGTEPHQPPGEPSR